MKKEIILAVAMRAALLITVSLMVSTPTLSQKDANLYVSNVWAAKGPLGIDVAASVTDTSTEGCGPFTFTLWLNLDDNTKRQNPIPIARLEAGLTDRRTVSFPLYDGNQGK